MLTSEPRVSDRQPAGYRRDPEAGGQVLEQVSRALEVMVVLVTICGVLLLLAQVQVGMRQRHQELVVYRTLGAGKRLLRMTLWARVCPAGAGGGSGGGHWRGNGAGGAADKGFDFPWELTGVCG
jgi:putative ABC transport system permease protein